MSLKTLADKPRSFANLGEAMPISSLDFEQLAREHCALMRDYARAQDLCSLQIRAQAQEIERLQAQAMRLRAEVIMRETALAWAREDRAALERAIPTLPSRVTLAHRVDTLLSRIAALMRQRTLAESLAEPVWPLPSLVHDGLPSACTDNAEIDVDASTLEDSLRAADLVICQTGCLTHGDYWRVQDHCKRTGKTCVMVEEPEALRIMRIRGEPSDESGASTDKPHQALATPSELAATEGSVAPGTLARD